MDPFSIACGIIAVGQATTAVAKCAEKLYQISYNAGKLEDEVQFFACHIDVFASTISSVHSTIRDHYIHNSNSRTIRKLHEHAALRTLASQSKLLMRRIKKLLPRSKAHETGLGIWDRVRWVFMQKEERKDICLWMERVKLSFLLIMLQVMYEALQQRASNESSLEQKVYNVEKEMKKLRRQMKTHMKSIRVVRDRRDNLNRRQYHHAEEVHDIKFESVERVLLALGKGMIKDESSSGSPVLSTTTGSRSSDEVGYYEVSENYNPVDLGLQRSDWSPQPPLQASLSETSENTTGLALTLLPQVVPPDRQQTRSPELLPSSSSSTIARTERDHGTIEDANSDEGDYIAVHACDNLLYLDPDLNSEVLQGYVNSKVEPTSAILNSGFPENVISQQHAAQLGLVIEYFHHVDQRDNGEGGGDHLDENEDIEIDFGDGDFQLVIGRVSFNWRKSQKSTHSRSLKVTCLVCEYVPFQTPLVFGNIFLDRRKYYWGE